MANRLTRRDLLAFAGASFATPALLPSNRNLPQAPLRNLSSSTPALSPSIPDLPARRRSP
jgi:hypothetical protein